MQELNKQILKENIFKLLYFSGLTDIAFANMLGITSRQIIRIKNGDAEFNIDNINKACEFFNVKLLSINTKEIKITNSYREKLMNFHKGNTEYEAIIIKRPSITYAIEFYLLSNEKFVNEGIDVKQIKEIFISKGWNFSSAYISLAMSRNTNKILKLPHTTRIGKNIYKSNE